MKVGRIVSAWLGALCLGAALTAGCAVAGGKTGQAEAVQAASDGSECGGEERIRKARRAWGEADLSEVAEVERLFREFATCLKPALLAGRLADPEDHMRYSNALHYWADTLRHLGREEEAEALLAERMALSDAGVLKDPLNYERTQLLNKTLESGDLTRAREMAEEIIAKFPESQAAKWAQRKLDEMDNPPAKVCGKVTLADGGKGEITATIFNGFEEFFVTVEPGETYCLPGGNFTPLNPKSSESLVYIFLTAPGYQPNVLVETSAKDERREVPDVSLALRKNKKKGEVIGVAVRIYSGVRSGILGPYSDIDVTVRSAKKKFHATTGKDGIFHLELRPGHYWIEDLHGLYPPGTPIVVKAGETIVKTFYEMGMLVD